LDAELIAELQSRFPEGTIGTDGVRQWWTHPCGHVFISYLCAESTKLCAINSRIMERYTSYPLEELVEMIDADLDRKIASQDEVDAILPPADPSYTVQNLVWQFYDELSNRFAYAIALHEDRNDDIPQLPRTPFMAMYEMVDSLARMAVLAHQMSAMPPPQDKAMRLMMQSAVNQYEFAYRVTNTLCQQRYPHYAQAWPPLRNAISRRVYGIALKGGLDNA